MTVRERVLASRLIERVDCCDSYANQIGLCGTLSKNEKSKSGNTSVENKKKNYLPKREY